MKTDFIWLVIEAFDKGALKKIVFSRSSQKNYQKISGKIAKSRAGRVLNLEYFHPSTTVSQKNLTFDQLEEVLMPLADDFMQINLISTLGDAEYKRKNDGTEVMLGADKLKRKLTSADAVSSDDAFDALDRKKSYLINGNEPYLFTLGITDKNGRVHDKMQGKFRQIHRFLENLQAVYDSLPKEGTLSVYDLCCGKSYLSFAIYHYLTAVKGREVDMLCVDLKADVIDYCKKTAEKIGFHGMHFLSEDIRKLSPKSEVHLVVSLHACDVATDIVLQTATSIGARVILSTPCCQKYLFDRIDQSALAFATKHGHLKRKICDVLTDGLRVLYLEKEGYRVSVVELTDPQDTPKNTLLRAIKTHARDASAQKRYEDALSFLLGENAKNYLKEFEI